MRGALVFSALRHTHGPKSMAQEWLKHPGKVKSTAHCLCWPMRHAAHVQHGPPAALWHGLGSRRMGWTRWLARHRHNNDSLPYHCQTFEYK